MNESANMIDKILSEAIVDSNMRFTFYRAFLELELIVLGTVAPDETDQATEPTDQPTLLLKYIDIDNQLILPVYSSLAKFNSIFKLDYSYIKITARELLPLIEQNASIILNPGFDLSKKIIPEEIEILRDGRILPYLFEKQTLQQKEQWLTDQIVEVPSSIKEVMTSCFRTFPSIKKAYLTNIYNPKTGDGPTPIVGLEIDHQDKETSELLLKISDTIKQKTNGRPKIEFIILDESHSLRNPIVKNIEPFYKVSSIDILKSLFL